jgi:hypothetical protein
VNEPRIGEKPDAQKFRVVWDGDSETDCVEICRELQLAEIQYRVSQQPVSRSSRMRVIWKFEVTVLDSDYRLAKEALGFGEDDNEAEEQDFAIGESVVSTGSSFLFGAVASGECDCGSLVAGRIGYIFDCGTLPDGESDSFPFKSHREWNKEVFCPARGRISGSRNIARNTGRRPTKVKWVVLKLSIIFLRKNRENSLSLLLRGA